METLVVLAIYPDLFIVYKKLVAFPIPDLEHGMHVQTAGRATMSYMDIMIQ
jgi:hypothetical protein